MKARTKPRVLLTVKRSGWRAFVEERSEDLLKMLVRRGDVTVARLREAHDSHERTIDEVYAALDKLGADHVLATERIRDVRREQFDLAVSVGGDGTLLRASHLVVDVPILGINSVPSSSVGFFCGARQGRVFEALERALSGRLQNSVLTRMCFTQNDEVVRTRILNDALFCHASPAATSRYIVEYGRQKEEQKSSGFWIGPAAGSTAAQRSAGGKVLPLTADTLQFVVREPYTPLGDRLSLTRLMIGPKGKLIVRCKMRQGAIFFDGPDDMVEVRFGDVLSFARAEEPLTLLGITKGRKKVFG